MKRNKKLILTLLTIGLVIVALTTLYINNASNNVEQSLNNSQKASQSGAKLSPESTKTEEILSPDEAGPKIAYETIQEEESVPFPTQVADHQDYPSGTDKVVQEGTDGVRVLTYQVEYTDGIQTDKVLISNEITKQPLPKVILHGTGPSN